MSSTDTTTITITQADYDALLHQIAELQSRLEVAEKPKKKRSVVRKQKFADLTHNEETSRLVDMMTDNGAIYHPVNQENNGGNGSQCYTKVRKGFCAIYKETLEEALVLLFETLHKKNGAILHSKKGWGVRSFDDTTDIDWALRIDHKTITNGGEEWIGWKDGERKEMEAFWKAWKGVDTLPPPQSPLRSPTQKKKKAEKKEEKEESIETMVLEEVAREQEEERVARNEAEEKANKEAEEAREEEEDEDDSDGEVEGTPLTMKNGDERMLHDGKIYIKGGDGWNEIEEDVEAGEFNEPLMKDAEGLWFVCHESHLAK